MQVKLSACSSKFVGTIPHPYGRGSVWSRVVTTLFGRGQLPLPYGRGSVVVLYDLLFGRENLRKGTTQPLDRLAYLRRYRLAKLNLGRLNPYEIDIKLNILTDHIGK